MDLSEKQKRISFDRKYFWLLLSLPSILTIITIVFSLFTDFLEYGYIGFIAPTIIVGLNLLVIILVLSFRMINVQAEKRLSEEIELKNYEKYSEKFYIDWRKITKMVYLDEISNEKCDVCKLPLHEKEFILQCPECQALFHIQHLIEWLGNDDACPICTKKITIT